MRGCEDPLGADQGSAAQILVERVDERHLPAPLPGGGVIPAHYAARPVCALHPAHILVGHKAVRRLWRPLLVNGGRHTSDLALDPVSGSLEREVGTDKLEAGSRVISADVVIEERLSDGLLGIEQRTSRLVRIEAMFGKALSEFLLL